MVVKAVVKNIMAKTRDMDLGYRFRKKSTYKVV